MLSACVSLGALPAAAAPVTLPAAGALPVPVGLTHAASGLCKGWYEVANTNLCTHGPDPVPAAVRERGAPAPTTAKAVSQASAAVACDGNGEDGKRVQGLYVHVAGRQNRRSTYLSSFRSWAADVDGVFRASAAETGGTRRLRWVTGSDCLLSVPAVAVSSLAESNFATMISELAAVGYNRNDRKYLVWFDSDPRNSPMCGIATAYADDRASGNINDATTGYARADYACWNFSEPHELMHTLGAVQRTAPHATNGLHCSDEYDQMCYQDAPTSVMTFVCPASHEQLFDCGHDDYFSTRPAPGSYLATHWNTADSGWLVGAGADTSAPVVERPGVSFLAGRTLTKTAAVRLSWPEATDESSIAAYELQRKKNSGSWVNVTLGSAKSTSVDLNLSVGAKFTFRLRARDSAGNTGAWVTTPAARLTLLQETAKKIVYVGTFKRRALSGASGGYVRHAAASGRTATLTSNGVSVAFVSTVGPNRGTATVRLDGGTVYALDFYASTQRTKQVVWAAAVGEGTHTVEITVTGVQNPASTSARIDIDAFLVWKPVT